jgi:cytochrome o ubiquinol oxidase subunit III
MKLKNGKRSMESDIKHQEKYPDPFRDIYSRTIFGMWLFLLSDFILFGVLYATYAVLRTSTFGGPSAQELISMPLTFMQTIVLLTSSFTAGLAGAYTHRKEKKMMLLFWVITFVLGLAYLAMELQEFNELFITGNGWQRNAFLSSFFTLLGTHGMHVFFGLMWMVVLLLPVIRGEITPTIIRRMTCLRMFWQFLNVVWIFIFSFVYIGGIR